MTVMQGRFGGKSVALATRQQVEIKTSVDELRGGSKVEGAGWRLV
jgi:hypothetical protein